MQLQRTLSSPVKNVQRGVTTIAAGVQFASVNISAVNRAKSFVNFSLRYNGTDNPNIYLVSGRLSADATLYFQRESGTSSTTTIDWEVIEYV